MAMVYCTECGKQISSEAFSCPSCGKVGELRNSTISQKQKHSTLSILALIFVFIPLLNIVGVILAIIDLAQNNKTEKHVGSVGALVLFALSALVIFL